VESIEQMRKLASIQKILDIQPIIGADAIEVATINGWQAVIKKNEFAVGDLVVYIEVDAWVPYDLAPFLSKSKEPREFNGVKGERLRTIRLRGQISQGLILPLSVLGERHEIFSIGENCVDVDVSEKLGVVKYDPPVSARLSGIARGNFPSSVPRTDEERIQNLTKNWDWISQFKYEITEKLEGASMTVAMIDGEFNVCSRNLNLRETEGNTLWELARKYDIENKMLDADYDNIAIQGECVGPGVEGNHYGLKEADFYVYSIYDIEAGKYVDPVMRHAHCKNLGLKHVPVIAHQANLFDTLGISTIEQVLKFADGNSAVNPAKLREGIVLKRIDGQEHFKAVSNEYLLGQK